MSYDPVEALIWEKNKWRYRPVTWPAGMENWIQPDFDAKQAGWKTGYAPFGHNDGKLAPVGGCTHKDHFCGCGTMPNTFWEKEVLLMRTTLDLPAMKEGSAYRMLVGGRSHVGSGDGSDVWINGTRHEGRRKTDPSLTGVGKRQGGKPWAFEFDETLRKEFDGTPVTIAATGFLPLHKNGVKKNHQSFWIEKMKLPTIGEREILHALKATPLPTSAWQESGRDDEMFTFTGTFEPNEKVKGQWKQVGLLADGEIFDPAIKLSGKRHWFNEITFEDDGKTKEAFSYYSGDLFIDLLRSQALKMEIREIGDDEYLFLEEGDFQQGKMVEETLPQVVFKRQ